VINRIGRERVGVLGYWRKGYLGIVLIIWLRMPTLAIGEHRFLEVGGDGSAGGCGGGLAGICETISESVVGGRSDKATCTRSPTWSGANFNIVEDDVSFRVIDKLGIVMDFESKDDK
jgi:hypothetical protein